MKILIIQNTDWIKRNPAQQHHLAELLSLRGHQIRVIDFEILWRAEKKKELLSKRKIFDNMSKIHPGAGITVIRPGIIKMPLIDYASAAFSHFREIKRQIKEFAPDVIMSLGIFAYLAGKAAKKHNIPFVYYWIDVSYRLIPYKFLQPLGRLIQQRTLKMADKILTINDKLKDHVIKLGASPDRVQVLRAGIYINRFNPNTCNGRRVREFYGIKNNEVVLFFMGWLYNFSGLKEVALQLAQAKDRNLKLLIVGEGDAYEELKEIKEKYGLQDRLILAGKKPYEEIPNFIAAADICLLPAYPWEKIMQDIVPIKMYEYMAMKKPVIATRLPGIVKEFGEGNGVVYIDRPEDAVTKAVELWESGKIEELGSRARGFVERYSWDKITDEFERILKEAIKEKQKV